MKDASGDIDENLYSRQLYALTSARYGTRSDPQIIWKNKEIYNLYFMLFSLWMKKMQASNVLIVGMNGLGVEIGMIFA